MNLKTKRDFILTTILSLLLLMSLPLSAAADSYGGAWLPNDLDIYTIELTPFGGGGSLYIYDYDQGTSDDLLLFQDGNFGSSTVYFSQCGSDWCADTISGGQGLNLGTSQDFGFYFIDGSTQFTTYDLNVITSGEVYRISADLFGSDGIPDMIVSISDAAPVPIPATILLLGSGIAGLVGLRRRMRA